MKFFPIIMYLTEIILFMCFQNFSSYAAIMQPKIGLIPIQRRNLGGWGVAALLWWRDAQHLI